MIVKIFLLQFIITYAFFGFLFCILLALPDTPEWNAARTIAAIFSGAILPVYIALVGFLVFIKKINIYHLYGSLFALFTIGFIVWIYFRKF